MARLNQNEEERRGSRLKIIAPWYEMKYASKTLIWQKQKTGPKWPRLMSIYSFKLRNLHELVFLKIAPISSSVWRSDLNFKDNNDAAAAAARLNFKLIYLSMYPLRIGFFVPKHFESGNPVRSCSSGIPSFRHLVFHTISTLLFAATFSQDLTFGLGCKIKGWDWGTMKLMWGGGVNLSSKMIALKCD